MKQYFVSALAVGAVVASGLGLAGSANAAPSGPAQVEQTVRTLEASGYNVIVNRTGAAALSACSVTAVRQGQTHSTFDSRGSSSPSETVTAKTVYVDVAC
jgi:hypothetical protein